MLWVQRFAQGPEEKQSTEVGFHVHLCTRTKRGLSLGLSSTKREEYFLYFFSFFLLLTPWGKAPALVWSHFSSAAAPSPLAGVTTIPHTVPCIPEKSVGKFLPLMGTMALTSLRCKQKKMIYVHLQNKKTLHESTSHLQVFFFFSLQSR